MSLSLVSGPMLDMVNGQHQPCITTDEDIAKAWPASQCTTSD
jgi:hypothetical protein